jgi:hypothetical protein
VPYEPEAPDDEVVEGLAFCDLRHRPEPWLRGTLHVLVLGRHEDHADRVWFRHYDLGFDPDRPALTSDPDSTATATPTI